MSDIQALLDAAVTVYLNGLIVLRFRKNKPECQAGMLLDVEPEHTLKVEMRVKGGVERVLPLLEFDSYELKQKAPLTLFIGKKDSDPPSTGSAKKYDGDCSKYPGPFESVLNFEGADMHPKKVTVTRPKLALLCLMQGTIYTATRLDVTRTESELDKTLEGVATLTAVALTLPDNLEKPYLILYSKTGILKQTPLHPSERYELIISNSPKTPGHSHNHFHEYYKALKPKDDVRKFKVKLPGEDGNDLRESKASPPCITVRLDDGDFA